MSNVEQSREGAEQVEDDDEPDEWYGGFFPIVWRLELEAKGHRDKRIFSTGCAGT